MISITKYISLFFLGLMLYGQNFAQTCDHIVIPDVDTYIDGDVLGVQPGDTICVQAGETDQFLKFINIHGTAQLPVVIQNSNGLVVIETDNNFGIVLDNCSNVVFNGQGDPQVFYGFRILKSSDHGFGIGGMSTDIEVKYIEIANTTYAGLLAKTDPDCTFAATREKFTMKNTKLHHLYIHDCGTEGMYIGSSKYTGQYLYNCDTTVLPHVMEGVSVYANKIERTGWDGIQVSSATKDCYIYDNFITLDSQNGDEYQMAGILIGGGTSCECFNNRIIDGKGGGIEIFGRGDIKIYNNVIVNPGQTHLPGNPSVNKSGIYCDDVVETTLLGSTIHFFNNTIINPRKFGIKYRNERTSDNKAYNNCIINPGAYNTDGESAYINTDQGITMDLKNNYFHLNIDNARFEDPDQYDYEPQSNSPLVNTGRDLSDYGVIFDINNVLRPFRNYFDIGAYECDNYDVAINEQGSEYKLSLIPNPITDRLQIELSNIANEVYRIILYGADGRIIMDLGMHEIHNNCFKRTYMLDELEVGVYFLQIKSYRLNIKERLIKL